MKFAILVSFCFFFILETDGSVSKCYFCDNKCASPLEVKNCDTDPRKSYLCWTSVVEQGTTRQEDRKCVEDTLPNKQLCDFSNKGNSMCKMCDTDLCNSAKMFSISVVLLSVTFGFLISIL